MVGLELGRCSTVVASSVERWSRGSEVTARMTVVKEEGYFWRDWTDTLVRCGRRQRRLPRLHPMAGIGLGLPQMSCDGRVQLCCICGGELISVCLFL